MRTRTPRTKYRILLTCGCTVIANNTPLNPLATYACTSGQAHGYTLNWVSHTTDGGTFIRHNQGTR